MRTIATFSILFAFASCTEGGIVPLPPDNDKICPDAGPCSCPAGLNDCGTELRCFDLENDISNCGQCGRDATERGGNQCVDGAPICTTNNGTPCDDGFVCTPQGCLPPPIENCDREAPRQDECGDEMWCFATTDLTSIECQLMPCETASECDEVGFSCEENLCRCINPPCG